MTDLEFVTRDFTEREEDSTLYAIRHNMEIWDYEELPPRKVETIQFTDSINGVLRKRQFNWDDTHYCWKLVPFEDNLRERIDGKNSRDTQRNY